MKLTGRELPAHLRDGAPFIAAATVIERDKGCTSTWPVVGQMAFRDGLLCYWPSGMSVVSDIRSDIRVDEAVRPQWMELGHLMRIGSRVGTLWEGHHE